MLVCIEGYSLRDAHDEPQCDDAGCPRLLHMGRAGSRLHHAILHECVRAGLALRKRRKYDDFPAPCLS